MDLNGRHRSNLRLLDVEEVDVVSGDVDDCEKQHGVGTLPMEPYRLVQREKLELGSNEAHEVAAHGQHDEQDIERQYEAGASRQPYGKREGVQTS